MKHGNLPLVPATMLQLLLGAFFPCVTLAAPFHINKLTLFPDKNAWCEAKNITQIISHEGCNSISIQNRACMGQCFSYSVPKTLPQSTESLVHCDSCMPSTIQWEIISLDCALNRTPRVEKLVEKILDCNCHACEDQTPYLKAEVRNQPGVTYVPQLPEGQAAEAPPQPHKAHGHPRRAHAHPHKATQD